MRLHGGIPVPIKLLRKNRLIRDSVVVFLGSMITGAANLLFQLVSVRMLSPEDYGTLNALLALTMVTLVAFSPLATALSGFFSTAIARDELLATQSIYRTIFRHLSIFAIIFAGIAAGTAFPLSSFIRTDPYYVAVCGVIVVASLFSTPVISLLQSFQKFKTYSAANIISAAVKLASGAVLMALGMRIAGALFGMLIGALIIPLIALMLVPRIFRKKCAEGAAAGRDARVDFGEFYSYLVPVAAAMVSYAVLTNVDAIMVKRYFSALDAGYYSVAQLVGKIFLFLPSALAIVILPKAAAAHARKQDSRRILRNALLLAGMIGMAGSSVCFLMPETILKIITNKANPASAGLLGIISLAMSFFALILITINSALATRKFRILVPLIIGAILEIGGFIAFHSSLSQIAYILLFVSIATFIATFFMSEA